MPKYLSLDDSKKLLNVAENEDNRNYKRDYAITTLFLNCGMRLSELVGININDIDFNECKMTVIGKGNKERTIYLNKSCMVAISSYLNSRPPSNMVKHDSKNSDKALFLSEQKQRISNRTVQNIITKELKHAGKNLYRSMHKAVEVPGLAADALHGLMKGQTRVNLDLHASNDLAQLLRRLVRNVVMGLWVMALLISSSIICTTNMSPKICGIPAIGAIGYLFAFAIVMYVLIKHILSK